METETVFGQVKVRVYEDVEYDYNNQVWEPNPLLPDSGQYITPKKDVNVYNVYMEHQCNEWDITDTCDLDCAIADVEQFISNCNEALHHLRSIRNNGNVKI